MFGKFRRMFPDRSMARQCLTWMPVGKTIIIEIRGIQKDKVTMTENGLVFEQYKNLRRGDRYPKEYRSKEK